MKTAIYAGTFDPFTVGHLDVSIRAARIFDRLFIGIGVNSKKTPKYSLDMRSKMICSALSASGVTNALVTDFEGLLVKEAEARNIQFIVRGLRLFTDFENEFTMSLMNRRLSPDIESVYLMPKEELSYISSSAVREVLSNGGSVKGLVPESIEEMVVRNWRYH